MRCVLSDPGVISSNTNDARELWLAMETGEYHPDVAWHKCVQCEVRRPPRAHHCSLCGSCILRFDHHCPWINNCVGKCNHRYFIQFLVYTNIFIIFTAMALLHCPESSWELQTAHDLGPFSAFWLGVDNVQTLSIVVFFPLVFFITQHTLQICFGMTSLECILWLSKGFPHNSHDRGCQPNWRDIMGDNILMWFLPLYHSADQVTHTNAADAMIT